MTLMLLLISAISFAFFGAACLASNELRAEFSRYGLARWRTTVGCFQLLGAAGLVVEPWLPWAALIASAGLAAMMLLGVCVRVKIRDSFLHTLPALFYTLLNAWLFLRLAGNA